ncbi:hypothetical protein H8356DRAFT_1331015 [Neocallimastix lanati (nom. inval.)]|nr:hypothetical protein H8356DRAFT_1331015 [Neocallimastix sp. JGI-2020a]
MDDQLEINETNKEKNQIIYITNNTTVIKCTKYKTVKKLRYKMKNEIRKTSIPFDINPKHIYNEIFEEIGLICSEYNESEYYINERDENFMIYKNSNIIIFQSSFPIPNRILPPKILQYDFEKGISNVAIKIFSNITIKYFIWHYKRSLKTCLYKYNIQYWNYYNDINHITNNASESFNNYLKKLEEPLSYNNYKRKTEGESELIDKKCDKNDIIDLWYKCLLELNEH